MAELAVTHGASSKPRAERCETCKFWKEPGYKRATEHRICERIEHENEADVAYVQDYESYDASLWTLAEFGCSLWEAKPLPTAEEVRGILG